MEIITLSREQYQQDMAQAIEIAVTEVLKKVMPQEPQIELLGTTEAMEYTGYKQHAYFKKFITRNKIKPFKREGKKNLYRKSDLVTRQAY